MSASSTLRPSAAVLALMTATVVLCGCSTTDGRSAPSAGATGTAAVSSNAAGGCSSVAIAMRSGSVPAPHNYRWTMTLEGDQGTLVAEGGEPGAQPWDRAFTADADSRAALCAFAAELAHQGPADGVGGSTVQAEYTPEGGSPVSGEQGVDGSGVPERMAQALPAGEWAALDGQLEAWSNAPDTSEAPTS